MTTDPWPPEGTRVRIRGGILHGLTGKLLAGDSSRRWILLEPPYTHWTWLTERHEIEVIDDRV